MSAQDIHDEDHIDSTDPRWQVLPVSTVLGQRRLVVTVAAPKEIHLNWRGEKWVSIAVLLAVRVWYVPIDNDGIYLAARTLISFNLYTTVTTSATTAT